jgi:hypothetical protein
MKSIPLRLKHASGWFAAGREVAEALTLLSDAAFKLFLWLCLHADRSRGAVRVNLEETAKVLGKSATATTEILEDLFLQGICRAAAGGEVEITDRFWPYERAANGPLTKDAASYLDRVKRLMLARACVRSVFSAADQKLALQLYQRGIPIERVERAVHLGCLRKYATLLNRPGGSPITSLHYFTLLLEEVERPDISGDYWRYVAVKVDKLERQWSQTPPMPEWKPPAGAETK